jgi:hypothetical protein
MVSQRLTSQVMACYKLHLLVPGEARLRGAQRSSCKAKLRCYYLAWRRLVVG